MQLKNHLNKSKIFSIFLIFSIVLLIFLSGCVQPQCVAHSKKGGCIAWSPSAVEVTAACKAAVQIPSGYTFCGADTGKSCDSLFKEKLDFKTNNLNGDSAYYLDSSRSDLVTSWNYANDLVQDLKNMRANCGGLFSVLKGGSYTSLKNYYNSYHNKMSKFNDAYNSYNENYITSLILLKNDLEVEQVYYMGDTALYKDYEDLMMHYNTVVKELGKDINVEESSAKDMISFYKTYFDKDDGSKSLLEKMEKSSEYSKCLAENDNNLDKCFYENLEETKQISSDDITNMLTAGYWAGMIGTGVTGFIAASIFQPEIGVFLAALGLVGTITYKIYDYIITNMSAIDSMNDMESWKHISYGKDMLEAFAKGYGPNSKGIYDFYSLVDRINTDLELARKDLNTKEYELKERIKKMKEKIDKSNEFYYKHQTLYTKFGVDSSVINIYDTLEMYEDDLKALKNSTLGNRYSEYRALDKKLDDLEKSIYKLSGLDETSLLIRCNSFITSINVKLKDLDGEDVSLLKEYIKAYNKETNKDTKLYLCEDAINLYDPNISYECFDALKTLTVNAGIIYPTGISKNKCYNILDNLIDDYKGTEQYQLLHNYYNELRENYDILLYLRENSNCLSYKSYKNISNYIYSLNQNKNRFSDDVIVANLMKKSFLDMKKELEEKLEESNELIKNNLGCYFALNYEIENDTLAFYHNLGSKNISYSVELPIADLVSNIEPEGCLKNAEIKTKYVYLDFKCFGSNMVYDIALKKPKAEETIKFILGDIGQGTMIQHYCAVLSNKNLKVELPIEYEKINSVQVVSGFKKINFELTPNGLNLLLPEATNKKQCYDIIYKIKDPISINYNVTNYAEGKTIKYTFAIVVKNNLPFDIDNVLIRIPNANGVAKDVVVRDNSFNSYKVVSTDDFFIITLSKLNSLEEKQINLFASYEETEDTINEKLSNLSTTIEDLNIAYKKANIDVSSIKKEIEDAMAIKEVEGKAKKLVELAKKVEEVKAKVDRINALNKRYINLKNSLSNYVNNSMVSQLEKFKKYANIDLEDNTLPKVLKDAENKYDNGQLEDAVASLEQYNPNAKVKLTIKNIFNKMKELLSDYRKKSKITGANIKDETSQLKEIGAKITYSLSIGDVESTIDYLESYDETLNKVKEIVEGSENTKLEDIEKLLEEYDLDKKNMTMLWALYDSLNNAFNSEKISQLENLGVKFKFTKRNIDSLKNRLDVLSNKIQKLDELKSKFEEKKDISLIGKSDIKRYKNFIEEFNDIKNTLDKYNQELQTKANQSITYANSKFGDKKPVELYKAKEALDQNKYVDALYYSKVALFALNKSSSNTLIWIITIAAILFIVLVFIRYKNLIKSMFKKKKKVQRRTYYTIDKDDDEED